MAALEIDIQSNASVLASVLGGVARSQIPYATTLALNDMAFLSMREAKSEIAETFDVRNRFSQSGIQVNKASKGDWPNTRAEVGIEERRSYLVDHVTGGNRSGNPAHGQAVLQDSSLRNARGRVPKGKRPSAMLRRRRRASNAAKPFVIKKQNGQELIAQRTSDNRYPIEILYAFERKVSIRREYKLDEIVRYEVQHSYESQLFKRLQQAVKSYKAKP